MKGGSVTRYVCETCSATFRTKAGVQWHKKRFRKLQGFTHKVSYIPPDQRVPSAVPAYDFNPPEPRQWRV